MYEEQVHLRTRAWMLITRNQHMKVNNELEINTHNSVGEPGSDIEGEEIVGEDDRDSISGKRIIGESTT
jgi:hypothetical protein